MLVVGLELAAILDALHLLGTADDLVETFLGGPAFGLIVLAPGISAAVVLHTSILQLLAHKGMARGWLPSIALSIPLLSLPMWWSGLRFDHPVSAFLIILVTTVGYGILASQSGRAPT